MTSSINKQKDWQQTVPIDQVGVEERIARLNSRSIKKDSKIQASKLALSMIDLTTLAGKDSPGKVRQLCQKAKMPHVQLPDLPSVAAVCVYLIMVSVGYYHRFLRRVDESHHTHMDLNAFLYQLLN